MLIFLCRLIFCNDSCRFSVYYAKVEQLQLKDVRHDSLKRILMHMRNGHLPVQAARRRPKNDLRCGVRQHRLQSLKKGHLNCFLSSFKVLLPWVCVWAAATTNYLRQPLYLYAIRLQTTWFLMQNWSEVYFWLWWLLGLRICRSSSLLFVHPLWALSTPPSITPRSSKATKMNEC